jgi:hypothetical protein
MTPVLACMVLGCCRRGWRHEHCSPQVLVQWRMKTTDDLEDTQLYLCLQWLITASVHRRNQ